MTNCPNCGKPNEDLQSHCVDCGQSLVAEPEVTEATQPQTAPDTAPLTPSPLPQPKKKPIGLYLCGGILGIAAVVGIVFLVLAMMNPMRAVATAANKTLDAFTQQIGSFNSLEAFGEAYDNYMTADRTGETFTIALGSADAGAICITANGTTDYTAHQLGLELSLGTEGGDSIVVPIYVDDNGISATAPQLLKDTMFYLDSEYVSELLSEIEGMPITELKDIFNREAAETMTDEQLQSIAALKNAFTQLMVNAKPQKQELYTHGEAQWTPYLMTFQEEDTKALENSLHDFLNVIENAPTLGESLELFVTTDELDELVSKMMQMLNQTTVYINDQGYLVGYSFVDSTDCRCMVALEGKENPWTRFAFYDDDTCVAQGELTNADGVVTLTIGDGEYTSLLHLTYEDATGTFTITDEEEELTLSFRLNAENDQAIFRFSMAMMGVEMGVDVAMGSSTETFEKPAAEIFYDVATMTAEESEALLTKVNMTLFTDPEVYSIVEDIVTVLQGTGLWSN